MRINKQKSVSSVIMLLLTNILPPKKDSNSVSAADIIQVTRLLYLELYFAVLAAVMARKRDKILLQNELRLFGTEMNIQNVLLYLHYDDTDRAGL
jgi:hypothetical protein